MCAVLGVEGVATDDIEAAARERQGGHDRRHRGHDRARARSTTSAPRSRCASATACGSTSTPPTAASSPCSTSSSRWTSFRAIADADSVVVDPHKHGLQPYGCGAVLFRDPGVGRLYKHDSPYTYFTSGDLHLGEISLECSRAGAAAAALWLTLRSLDLEPILLAGVRAARAWADAAARFRTSCACTSSPCSTSSATTRAAARCRRSTRRARACSTPAWQAEDPVYLSTLRVGADAFPPDVERDADGARILRSVLMKPEHEPHVPWLHQKVTEVFETVSAKRPV